MEAHIREAATNDREAIVAFLTEMRLGAEHILVPGTRYWLAEESGATIGVVGLECGADAALLRSAGVAPAWRGRTIGRTLVDHACAAARDAGVGMIYLFSTGAGAYWQRRGFVEVPVAEVVTALPYAPQVLHYAELGWLPTEIAWRRDIQKHTT